jgi:hypothetical protein
MDSITSRRRPATTSSTRAGDRLKIYISIKFTWICHALCASSSSSLWDLLQNLRLHVAIDQQSMNLEIAVCFSPCWDHMTFLRCFRFSTVLILQIDKHYMNLQIAVLCFCPNWDNHCSKSSLSRLFSPKFFINVWQNAQHKTYSIWKILDKNETVMCMLRNFFCWTSCIKSEAFESHGILHHVMYFWLEVRSSKLFGSALAFVSWKQWNF